jgi:CRP/FNR family cyclic AMP-dependent transcriptional regulator
MAKLFIGILYKQMTTTRSPKIYRLIKTGTYTKYAKGQIIQSTEGHKTMNFITQGFVKRYLISNTGNLGVEVIYGSGDFFPLTLMLDTIFKLDIYEGAAVYFYEAMTETVVYTLSADQIAQTAEEDPLLYKEILHETGRRLHTLLNSLENLALQSPYNRLSHQLIYFATTFGTETKNGVKVPIPLTAQDLADILSLNAKGVERCLEALKRKNLIKFNKNIIITDLDRLKAEAHS